MDDLKDQMQDNFLKYASYVILDRAIPNVFDGLKPVQRRILHTLFKIDDGKFHKVANVAGQTMAFHPHGDAPITEALVNLANKNYLLEKQGNFGNLYTGDPAAAARYIETKLSDLARETLFNPELTDFIPSYDGRNQEPIVLPAKIPLLLMQGAEGIAVGMATKILPHNFNELIDAEIAYLEGKPFEIHPDFPTGGLMDPSNYEKGLGKIRLRAKLTPQDAKTIIISEICYGTSTESLIQSIDEAAKKGKIKIDSISDFTSDKVEIEIKLPRGQVADSVIDALYAFTECEVNLSSQIVVIHDNKPIQTNIHEIITLHADKLQELLQKELQLEQARLNEKIFYKTLERIFISNRLYKKIEEIDNYDLIHDTISKALASYKKELLREPTYEDREKLLSIPIRRISRFDINKNEEEIAKFQESLIKIEKDLKNITKYTIQYLKHIKTKFGKHFPRKTEIQTLSNVDLKALSTKKTKIFIDVSAGFIGTKIVSSLSFECTNFDKILLIFENGSYLVTSIEEKKYVYQAGSKLIWAGVVNKEKPFTLLYFKKPGDQLYIKKFLIDKFILDKVYRLIDETDKLHSITHAKDPTVQVEFKPLPKQKNYHQTVATGALAIKSVTAKGIRLSDKAIKAVCFDVPSNLDCTCVNS